MRKLLFNPFQDNCKKEPIRFFKTISQNDLVTPLKEFYITNLNDSDIKDLLQFDSLIFDDTNDTFSIKRNPVSRLPEGKIISIENLIIDIIQFQVDLAIYYLNQDRSKKTIPKSRKEFFQSIENILSQSAQRLQVRIEYKKFLQEIMRHYALLASYLYTQHESYFKKRNDYLNELLSLYEDTNLKYKPRGLQLTLISDILTVEDKKKKSIFLFQNDSQTKIFLKYFMRGEIHKITSPINFISKSEPAYYLIFKLCQYLDINENNPVLKDIFQINGKMYSDKSSYSAKNRIQKRNNDIKSIIDSIIIKNLV